MDGEGGVSVRVEPCVGLVYLAPVGGQGRGESHILVQALAVESSSCRVGRRRQPLGSEMVGDVE